MNTFLLIVHVLIAFAIIGLVLIQHGKGADVGASFGSGASTTIFGSQGSGSFLSKATIILALLFVLSSIGLIKLGAKSISSDIVDVEKLTLPDNNDKLILPDNTDKFTLPDNDDVEPKTAEPINSQSKSQSQSQPQSKSQPQSQSQSKANEINTTSDTNAMGKAVDANNKPAKPAAKNKDLNSNKH